MMDFFTFYDVQDCEAHIGHKKLTYILLSKYKQKERRKQKMDNSSIFCHFLFKQIKSYKTAGKLNVYKTEKCKA